ncbi:MAG: ABC transporter ATP-binding protein [Firmicutes bacterium]|nr:ABC transporter ATP-binding protein [Bacillota bacterium]
MSLIELKNIFFEYEAGEPVLTDLNLDIDEGSCLVVVGDNGSGKTTLFRILNGLSFPGKGSYVFDGQEISAAYLRDNAAAKRFHKRIGYLFQNTDTLLFNSRVYDEIAFGPRQMGLADEETDARVMDCLRTFGIEDLREKVPYHLSGGQKKWVALAAVMALNPEVLVLDEPFAGLDRKKEEWLLDFLKELKASGKTLIIATHKEDLLAEIADNKIEL